MSSRVCRMVALIVALIMVLGAGVAIGGGIVYAATRVIGRTPRVAPTNGIDPESGIVIVGVLPDGSAAEAGVVRGDIVLTIDGEQVDEAQDVWGILEKREPGDEVELTVLHGDEERTLTATLGDRDGGATLGLMSCGGLLDVPPVGHRILGLGALIVEVMPDSPAEQAGLQEGDHIAAVGGEKLGVANDLADLITAYEPGDAVTLAVKRPGEESRGITVVLGEHPDEEGRAYLGVRYLSLPRIQLERHEQPFPLPRFDSDRDGFGIGPGSRFRQGAIIRKVVEDSPAEAAGLREGDLITAIAGEPVEDPRALADAIAEHKPGDAIMLTVARPDEAEEREVEVTLGESPEDEGSAYLGVMVGSFFMLRSGDSEFPPGMELPGKSFRFKLPFMKEPFELDLDDALRRFEFRFRPRDTDMGRPSPPGDSV